MLPFLFISMLHIALFSSGFIIDTHCMSPKLFTLVLISCGLTESCPVISIAV